MFLEVIAMVLLGSLLTGIFISEFQRIQKAEKQLIRPRLDKRTFPRWIR